VPSVINSVTSKWVSTAAITIRTFILHHTAEAELDLDAILEALGPLDLIGSVKGFLLEAIMSLKKP
jgi:hypothetical protein